MHPAEPLDLMSHDIWWRSHRDFALSSVSRRLGTLAKQNVSDEDLSKRHIVFRLDDGIAQMLSSLTFLPALGDQMRGLGIIVAMRVPRQDIAPHSGPRNTVTIPARIVAHGKSPRR